MFLHKIRLENILSFKDAELELRPLNVLIGANASGKSNLIRSFGLLRSLPKDMSEEIAKGGGPRGWINQRTSGTARLNVRCQALSIDYELTFRETGRAYEIVKETAIDSSDPRNRLFERDLDKVRTPKSEMPGAFSAQKSVLSEMRYPGPMADLAKAFASIRLYREFKTGPETPARHGINASASDEYLAEDGANLAPVLSKLINLLGASKQLNEHLSRFFESFSEVRVHPSGGVSQVYVVERGVSAPFAATSLSDGTLRLLCLLAVLLDPTPPPLICIEEPEAGLHPDAIRMIADLLVEASGRTQIIITTHSPALVDALTDQPESVVVCERDMDGFTEFRRLTSEDLDEWLERYSLGELWQKGEIGGNRW